MKELMSGQGASVLAELASAALKRPSNASAIWSPAAASLLSRPTRSRSILPLRYLMIRSIEFTSVTGRFAMDVARRHRYAPYHDALFPVGKR